MKELPGRQPTPVDKLRQLEEFITDGDEVLYEFGRYLSTRVNPELVPLGFINAVNLAIYDLQAGVDGYTGKPIQGLLASLPDLMYPLLRMNTARIARAVYPEEFATQVEAELEEINRQMREQTRPKQPEVDHGAVMPGRDPFEMLENGEQIPSQGIFVSANLWKGSHGTFDVYRYNNVQYRLKDYRPKYDEEILYTLFEHDEESKQLQFAYERAGFVGKEKPPYDRGDQTTYIGLGWDELDAIDLPSKGRLLIMKRPWAIGNFSTDFRKHVRDLAPDSPRREVFSYFDPTDADGAVSCVEGIATKLIGLSEQDAKIMGEQVRSRIFPSTPIQPQ